MAQPYASERDFVARFLLPKLQDALLALGLQQSVDVFMEKAYNGTPDISVEKGSKKLFLIEVKFKKKTGRVERDIEPRDPAVIDQAIGYAVKGGFPFYATCNTKRLILFEFRPGVRAYESEIASFDFSSEPSWGSEVMQLVLGHTPVRLKPPDDSVADTFREAFDDLLPEILNALKGRLKTQKFKERYHEWLASQGIESSDETNLRIAEQTAYLQLNKLLFYKAASLIYPDRLPKMTIAEEQVVTEALDGFYSRIKDIDYHPIYQNDILTEIPLTERAETRLRTLVDTLNEFDFTKIESDFVGRLYERLIPTLERKKLGQFYTPPDIVDFIVRLTVRKGSDVVLDPGCGSGGFLVRAYHQLRDLKEIPEYDLGPPEADHQELLSQIYGVDINQFPAHLSVVNLALQSPRSRIKQVNVAVRDFFDIKPGIATLTGFESMTVEGAPTLVELPPALDVVVGNPPYIRQELVGEREKQKIKRLVEGEYKDRVFLGGSGSGRGKNAVVLNKTSDIYVYFVLHGLKFLKNEGLLAFITSDKWLSVEYGEPFQEFLTKNVKVLCLVEFSRALFPELEVDTVVMLVQRTRDEKNRNGNLVKFVRVKKRIPTRELLREIATAEEDTETDVIHLTTVRQGDLKPGKWSVYMRAPQVFHKISSNKAVRVLNEVADDVFYGTKTGNDNYFILPKERASELGIEKQFLKPCAPAGEKVKGLVIEPSEIDQVFFMVHLDKGQLSGTNALKYIGRGERTVVGPAKRRKDSRRLTDVETIKARTVWYSLPEIEVPSIIFPMWFRYKYRAFLNKAGAHANDYFYYIIAKKHPECLAAYLNSSVAELALEILGRQYSGMLHTKVYELKALPCIDIHGLSTAQKHELTNAFLELNSAMTKRTTLEHKQKAEGLKTRARRLPRNASVSTDAALDTALDEEKAARNRLNEVVYDILGLSRVERRQVEEALEELRRLRKQKSKGAA
jgi:type I restriction-modification system DNA methylase subunit